MSRLPSASQHSFARVPQANIQRSSFDRKSTTKTTLDAGWLVPVYVDEALPGDTFTVKMTAFGRMTTLLRPIMDNVYFESFFIAVPNRLLWSNWEKLNGEQLNPGDSTDYLVPQIVSPAGGYLEQSLFDYFGWPTKKAGYTASALWSRAYNLSWNELFRDENLQQRAHMDIGDGPDLPANYVLRRRGKRADYFASSLPFPQKGPSVSLSLAGNAPVLAQSWVTNSTQNTTIKTLSGQPLGKLFAAEPGQADRALIADMSGVAAATVNSIRNAFAIQTIYEKDARGGTRYIETIRMHFGVISPDARMQRPEYLGGGSTMININPIAQTSANVEQPTPLGNLSGIGTINARGHGFTKSFTEHSTIIGLVSIRADMTYQQGLHRMFSRRTRWDFFWPSLAHIGEQAVLNKEIFLQGTAADELVWGYQERSAEYRYKPSMITGKFRSNATGSLDYWHLGQNFVALPVLGSTYIEENPPIARVSAVPTEPNFLLDCFFDEVTVRPMPVFGIPGQMGRF